MNADICVVIPCHSWPQHFPEAFASIEAQTVKPWRVILAIDGVDPAPYEVESPNFEVVSSQSKRNRGVAHTLNRAALWAYQTSEWMFRLDEDDKLHPQCFERLLLSAELCPGRDIHYSDWVKFEDWCGYEAVPDYSYERLLLGPFITSACLMRTAVWKLVEEANGKGWDPEMKGWEDWLLFLEAGALGIKMARVGLGLVRVRKHSDSSVSSQAHRHIASNVAHIRKKLKKLYDIDLAYEVPDGLRVHN